MLIIAPNLDSSARAGASPGFFDYAALWDGQWYWYIAANGYPTTLPLDSSGLVAENQWAFMPLYPAIVSGLAGAIGIPWPTAAFLVSLAFGFAAALVLYRLFRIRLDHTQSLFAVTLFAVSPLSFILQMAYAESMQLFFLALALLLVERRRWLWLVAVIPVMALTRPTGLAFALMLALYFVVRWLTRDREPFPARDRWWVIALTALSGVMGLAWPAIAWAVTGSVTAYTDTELAWRSAWIGQQHLIPFTPWFQAAPFWVGAALAPLLVIVLVAGFAAVLLFVPAVKRLGHPMRLWMAAYGIYLFAFFFPQSSVLRILMPMFPLAGALAVPRSTTFRTVLIAGSLALQFAWLWVTWGPVSTWWSIP